MISFAIVSSSIMQIFVAVDFLVDTDKSVRIREGKSVHFAVCFSSFTEIKPAR